MPDIINPYIPDQPADDPDLFFGRRDLFIWVREHLIKGRRIFVVSGAHRIGKTSFLRQLPTHLPEEFLAVAVRFSKEDTPRLDWLLWQVADAIATQAAGQLPENVLRADWSDFEGQPDRLLTKYWPGVRAELGDRCLVLMIDDLDSLARQQANLLDPFLTVMMNWRQQDENLALVMTTAPTWQETLSRRHPRLFGGSLTSVLGTLTSEDASHLITWPVDGVLTYDYGVPRRMVEITSGQPYYLQLLCFEVFNRCATAGWVNQRDLDFVIEGLVSRDIPEFRRVWDESTPQEQAVLAALVSLRGARGIATAQEVGKALSKLGARVDSAQVTLAMESLAARGILERLGALSYRFRVALLRDWLGERIDRQAVVRDTRWRSPQPDQALTDQPVQMLHAGKEDKTPSPSRQQGQVAIQASPGASDDEEPDAGKGRRWLWLALVVALVLVLAAILGRMLLPLGTQDPTPSVGSLTLPTKRPALATATLALATEVAMEATEIAEPTDAPLVESTELPAPTQFPTPAPSPTPTPPQIVARSVPSIAYQSREPQGEWWSIYVMDSNGGNRTLVGQGQGSFLSAPAWSPDGSRLAVVSDRDGASDIWVMGIDGSDPTNLTQHEAKDHAPAWSPDGEWIAFASVRDSPYWELYLMRADGSDPQRLTWWEDASDLWPTWSPDGTRLAFASKRDGNWEIYSMDRDGSNLIRLTNHPDDDTSPAWSPDGSRIAFESTREGYSEIFVVPVGGGEAVNVSRLAWATDLGPSWSPDGGRLVFYSDRDGEWDIYVMASDGSGVVKLTGDNSNDQVPAWRP
jgi:hypothetical protein